MATTTTPAMSEPRRNSFPSCIEREAVNVGTDMTRTAKKEMSPPEAEMEEFFAAAESSVARRFAAKYNYDVVKDAPMDGRYEWVRLSH